MQDNDCIFCKIISGKIPSRKLYEDDLIYAFHDINPAAPVHFLIIPKSHIPTLSDASAAHEAALGRMLAKVGELAREAGCTDGYRTMINCGRVGRQEVYHLHMHVVGGPDPLPPMLVFER
ncbi:histidine triad nucleotide-binding protein [Methyloversatilis sp. XJ19-49]|uniref:histidine triad nucleotide-binding protein n=1 Tax=Methyloversatilis sp. XJ19-49 TaxID=2963429 RepID=UPI00211C59CA|nr:histidine triad nucleotide-binding protein [Methyloversatilis sp. XJ19-49]MCQ9378491.1 histidine triad nucleotide-binding protein [Methyloversatilis sp. XJ19-49]